MKPFNDITTLFSRTNYPTSNLYFQGVSQIKLLLLEEMESQDSFINNMAEQMKVKVMFGNNFCFLFSKTCFEEYKEKTIFLYF